jgi:TRAP-type C4-dicarboxylate transport system substrate-binding protein
MKKKACVALILALVLLPLFAGGKQESASGTSTSKTSPKAAPAAGAGEIGNLMDKDLTIKFACSETAESIIGTHAWAAWKDISEKTKGEIKVEFFPNNSLGSIKDTNEQVMGGAPIAMFNGIADLAVFVPEVGVAAIPYAMTDLYDMLYLGKTQWMANLEGKFAAKNLKLISYGSSGFRHFVGKAKVATVDDVKKSVLRMGPNPILQGFAKIMGGSPTTSTWSDNYTLMQAGSIDACEASVDLLWTSSLAEVSKYLSLTGHFITPNAISINLKIWNSIPDIYQKIILRRLEEASKTICDQLYAKQDEYIQKFKEKGIIVIEPKDIDIAGFQSYMPKLMESLGYKGSELNTILTQIKSAKAAAK